MKEKILTGLATGVFLVGMVGLANATIINTNTGLDSPETTITFDELSLSNNTVVTDQYSSFGVTFAPNLYQTPQSNAGFANFDDDFLGNFSPVVNPFDINFLSDQTNVAFALVSNPATTIFSTYLDGEIIRNFIFCNYLRLSH